jgi:hypothetical protein
MHYSVNRNVSNEVRVKGQSKYLVKRTRLARKLQELPELLADSMGWPIK